MNTLAITDKLIASGTPEPQARAQAQIHEEKSRETKTAIKEEVAKATEGFVTRAELLEAIAALREDNAKLREGIANLKADIFGMIMWAVVGTITANTAMVALLLALFHNAPK